MQDGELDVTRIRGKQKDVFWATDPGLGYLVEDLFSIAYQPFYIVYTGLCIQDQKLVYF